MSEEAIIGRVGGKLDRAEDKLVVTITGEVYATLKRLSSKMRNASTPKEAVEIALELLIRAEGKDIALIDRGNVIATFNLWR